MFYLKQENNGTTVETVITDKNVFCLCPDCGREHAVDVSKIFAGGDADLFSARVYCPGCSKKRMGK